MKILHNVVLGIFISRRSLASRAGGIGLGSVENRRRRRRRVVTHVFTNNFLLSNARQILFSELFVHGQGVLSIYLLALCHLPN